jgi:hypothetical protein
MSNIYSTRSNHYMSVHAEKTKMLLLYNGNLPGYEDFFPDDIHQHILNPMRSAADDLTNMTAKVMPIFVPPQKQTAQKRKAAEKVENIAWGWNDVGRRLGLMEMKSLMSVWAHYLVVTGDAVGMVLPNHEHKTPFFTWRDPRSHLPPVGWTPYSQTPLTDTMFAYPLTLKELMARYPNKANELRRVYGKVTYSSGIVRSRREDEDIVCMVGEWYSKDAWYVGTLDGETVVLDASEGGDKNHPNCLPVVPFTLHNVLNPKGRSLFADQASLQAAMSRMVSQEIDYFDQLLFGTLFTTPTEDDVVKIGPGAVNVWDNTFQGQPRAERIAPAQAIQATQMISMLLGYSRVANRNPEAMQGAGDANSAKALAELKSGPEATVRDGFWPVFTNGLPKLYTAAAQMELKLWPHEKKTAYYDRTGGKGSVFTEDYVPAEDLQGYEHLIQIEPGFFLGGYAGTLEMLQMQQSGAMSMETFLEQHPYYREPEKERRRIDGDKLREAMLADLPSRRRWRKTTWTCSTPSPRWTKKVASWLCQRWDSPAWRRVLTSCSVAEAECQGCLARFRHLTR